MLGTHGVSLDPMVVCGNMIKEMKPFMPRIYWIRVIVCVLFLSLLAVNLFWKVPQSFGEYADEFPLSIDLNRRVFFHGEKISFTATITNNSGEDVNIITNGSQPCAFFCLRPIDKMLSHGEFLMARPDTIKAGETLSKNYEVWAIIPGVYYLDVHYSMMVIDEIASLDELVIAGIPLIDYSASYVGQLNIITIIVI